jgi:hypothetical protein
MKKLILLVPAMATLLLLATAAPAMAADTPKGKEITIAGEAKCAMCALKETEKCQTVIEAADKTGKTVKYYVADNDVAKQFHSKICKGPQKVNAAGTVKQVNGKNELTLTKIAVK